MLELIHGNATDFVGSADVVFCNPYAMLPKCLHGKPSIISLYEGKGPRREIAEEWIGGSRLRMVSYWGRGLKNTIYVANLDTVKVDLTDLVEDPPGWFPLDLVRRMLDAYAWPPGTTVWDGFMGRGTVGRVCAERGFNFIGMDFNNKRVEMARGYLA